MDDLGARFINVSLIFRGERLVIVRSVQERTKHWVLRVSRPQCFQKVLRLLKFPVG